MSYLCLYDNLSGRFGKTDINVQRQIRRMRKGHKVTRGKKIIRVPGTPSTMRKSPRINVGKLIAKNTEKEVANVVTQAKQAAQRAAEEAKRRAAAEAKRRAEAEAKRRAAQAVVSRPAPPTKPAPRPQPTPPQRPPQRPPQSPPRTAIQPSQLPAKKKPGAGLAIGAGAAVIAAALFLT